MHKARDQDVRIRYRRPPDREDVYVQRLVHEQARVLVTLLEVHPPQPARIAGEVVLEGGSPIIWFTFPGERHDIGRFHLADGSFTGIYADILTPPRFLGRLEWETTDLFLDVWIGREGRPMLLDEEELADAVARGWVDPATAAGAREEADRLLRGAVRGEWPPAIVAEWTLEKVRAQLGAWFRP